MASVKPAQIRQLRPSDGAAIRIRLVGPLVLEVAEHQVSISSKRAKALIAYLAQRGGSEAGRGMLAGLLWGERGEEQARASLRQTLSEIRAAFAAAASQPIAATGDSVMWIKEAAWVDAHEIAEAARSDEPQRLAQAAELLRGEFLEGLDIREPGFEQWIVLERERLRQLACSILARLLDQAEQAGQLEDALVKGQRLLAYDPLQEHVHRSLMRIYAAQNRPDAALAQFERCKTILASQLNVEPAPETAELVRTIKSARRTPASAPADASPAPSLPGQPSIVVLPFINLSNDAAQDYFADGITEDIISALSRISELFVIARSSSFAFKGQSVRAPDAARELGVRYVLEGSVRVAGERVRVNAQLIDGTTGSNVWTERYDGKRHDIFAVQDEITYNIAQALEIKLARGETTRLWESQTRSLRAWEKVVAARQALWHYTTADIAEARRLLEEALAIDPGYTGARAWLGITHYWDARFSVSLDAAKSIEFGEQQAELLLAADSKMSAPYVIKGALALMRDRHAEAIGFGEQAVQLAPGDARALAFLGMFRMFAGEPEKSFPHLTAAMKRTPKADSWYRYYLALAYLWTSRAEEALQSMELYGQQEPNEPYGFMYLAAIHGMQSRHDAAATAVAQLREKSPAFGLANVRRSERYKEPEKLKMILDAIRHAGLNA